MKWLVDSGFSWIPGNHSNLMWTVAGVNPAEIHNNPAVFAVKPAEIAMNPAIFCENPAVSANNPADLQ
ncbi:hypothetical protein [Rossellomorea sp. LJF3]|uniref:hypothetical protein n=1 Tax=Rossellomorea sp. LJF3 TaxID=3126099 RepID=UPI00300C5EB5